MKNSKKRNVAFLLAILIFIHGLPVQPMNVYAQNESELYFELNLTDSASVVPDATVEVKFLEEWIALTYDYNGEVYKGSCKGETVSGNLIEGNYGIRISIDGYKEIQKDIFFAANEENHLIGSFDIKDFKISNNQNKSMLRGNVKDKEGNPLSGVMVTIKNIKENFTYTPIVTGEGGSYEAELVSGFSYIFTFEKEDYESVSKEYTVSDDILDIEDQEMEKIVTYELSIPVTGEDYGRIEVHILSENTIPEKINEHTYKCKKGDSIQIRAIPYSNGFLAEETEKQMKSENEGGDEVDDGSSYCYVTGPMNESKEFEVVFEPAVYGLVRYEEGKVTYIRNGERGKIELDGNTWRILPHKENHYYVKNCIRSNETDLRKVGQNLYQFSGMGSGSLKIEYEEDTMPSQITLSENGIYQEGDRWSWFWNGEEGKRLDIFLKDSQRKLDRLELHIKGEVIEVEKEDIRYYKFIGYEMLNDCDKIYVRGVYQDACSNVDCEYCRINEEISIIRDVVPPTVGSISINNKKTDTFEQDGITYINANQAFIDAVISDDYNIKEIYYKYYKEKKSPEEIEAEYENGGLDSAILKKENILKIKEENNKITYKINCTIDTSKAATGVWYLYVVAKDYAGNIDFSGKDSQSYPFILGKDAEPPTVSVNEIGESKNGSNFKKQNDIINLEGIFKDEHTSNGLKYYVTEPIRIDSAQLDPKVWGKLEKNVKWICLGKNSNDQTGNGKIKTKNLYVSDRHTVSDNGSISGNGLDEGSYVVWLYAKDGCGNVSDGVSYVFHIDDRVPSLNYLGFGEKEEGKYFSFGNFFRDKNNNKNNKRIISIEAIGGDEKEVSYFELDQENSSLKPIEPEIEEIKLIYMKSDNTSTNAGSISQNNALWESKEFVVSKDPPDTDNGDGNKYILDFEIPEEAVFYKLHAVAKDKAGNIGKCYLTTGGNYESDFVMWDQTPPRLIEPIKPQQDADHKSNGKEWYSADRDITYQIKIEDKESGLNQTNLNINKIQEKNDNTIQKVERMTNTTFYDVLVRTKNKEKQDGLIDIFYKKSYGQRSEEGHLTASVDDKGKVTISCEATDNAGNPLISKTKESTIYIDQDKPVLTGITFTTNNNRIEGDLAVVPKQYGYFFKKRTNVTVYATDFIGTSQNEGSGVEDFVYYFKHSNGAETTPQKISATKGHNNTYSVKFSIPENFKGQLFVKAIDKTGQEGDYKTPRGIIIDSRKKHEQHSKAEIVLPETSYKDGEGNPLYSYLPEIEFKTEDEKSGIKENAWSVKPFHLSENEADGVLQVSSVYNKDTKAFVPQLNGDTDWNIPGNLDLNLITEANKKYHIKNQMNHMEAKLKLTDNAGNSLEETISVFSVDTTDPEIKVEYNNNDVSHEKYYKEPRTATITITERNFSEEGVELLITGDGVKKGEWQHHAEGGCNGTVHTDSCTYTCDVVFDEDGEYTLGVNCTDLAGNKGTYGQTDEFVIDLTAPVVMVTYDNNNAKNGRYYKEGRVGTIDIEEVNFDEEETIVTVTAKRQAEAIEVPGVSAFTKNEYHNRATVSYEQDGDYTFDIKVTDLAGNEAEIFTPEEFTIDTTPPELLVEGVKDGSANKGVVAPVITYEDINLEEDGVSISLTGANLGEVKYEQKVIKTENGRKISLGDFKHKKEVDDLYTLKTVVQDLAGNETIDEKTFSVNRFGSVYILDDSTKQLVEGFYSNKERDLIITEINVDSLQFQEIVASVDGEMTTLKEGRDFEVKAGTSDSSWKTYEYHIGAKNFKEEGAYVVTIYSEDRAENKSSNKAKGKELEFVIDKTEPSIVVAGIEDGGQYTQISREITLDVQDNILLENVDVYVDGKVISTTGQEELLESNGIVKLSLKGADRKQGLTVICRDAAGNQAVSQELSFLITKNLFVQWYSNKALFYGSIIGVTAIVMLLFWLRKRRDSKMKEA